MIFKRSLINDLSVNVTDGEHASVNDDENGAYFLLSNKNIKSGKIVFDEYDRKISEITFLNINRRTKLSFGDVVISTVGTIGKTAIIKDDFINFDFQRSVGIIKPDHKKLNTEYLHYYFQIPAVQKRLINLSKGAVQKCLFISDLRGIEIDHPTKIEDQEVLVAVLKSIDSKIELNNRINAELESMAKTIYDYWFVQFDFPDKNGKPYKTSGGKMVWNEELKREVPEGWESGELNKLGEIIGGSTPSKAVEENFCFGVGMPWITPKDLSLNKGKKYITRGELDVTESGLTSASLKIMPAGTVLLSSRAPIGYLAISRENVTTNQGFKSFIPRSKFSTEFIFYTIKNLIPEIEANSSGSTFQEVSTSTLRSIKTVFPSNDILTNFDKRIKPIFKQQDVLEEENQKLAELRDWLLPMLMNGQVRVD